jgi:hypothetical protein
MDGGAGSEYGEMQTRCVRWARSSVFGPRGRFGAGYRVPGAGYPTFRLSPRYPTLGHGRMRGEGDTTFPASFVQAEGREPKAGHRIRYPGPGTWHPCPIPTFRILTQYYCSVKIWMQDTGCIPRVRIFEAGDGHSAWCPVPSTRYRVPAIWHLGPGTRHRSQSNAEGRTPSTEDRAGKRAHWVCMMPVAYRRRYSEEPTETYRVTQVRASSGSRTRPST